MEDFGIQDGAPGARPRALAPSGQGIASVPGKPAADSSWTLGIAAPLATGATYYLAAKLGGWLAFPSAPVSAFWAPNAILLAALVLVPRERWSIYLLAVIPFHLLAQLPAYPLLQVLIQYVVNCAEALIGAYAIVSFCPQPLRYDRVRTAFVLIAFGGIIAPLLTSVVMAGAFVAVGLSTEFWLTLTVRTITNTFAIVALVPLIVHGIERLRRHARAIALERAVEACALAISLSGVGFCVFVVPTEGPNSAPTLLYAPLPLLAWAAVRFGVPGACGAALLVGALSTWGVLNGHGPFTSQDPVQNALSVVAFQVVTSVALVAFAALLEEWRIGARALSASEARFRNIFENNIIPTVIWREDLHVSEVNEAFLRLTGFSQADIDAGCLRIDELIAGSRQPGVAEPLHPDPLQRFDSTENELTLRDGRRIPVVLGQCRFSSGEPGGIMYALDLSAFRRAEAQRLTAENLHAAVLASVHDQVAVLDSAGTIIEVNDSWRRFVESAPSARFDYVLAGENFVAACARAAQRGDPGAAEQLSAATAVLDGSEVRRQLQFTAAAVTDEPPWFEISVERLRRSEGGAVVTRTDVTARKQAELEARNQRQQLAHLGRAAVLGQLSGAFAHELTQPLTSILGNAEAGLRLLERGIGDPAELAEILRDIVQDDERAAQVIHGLRALLHKGETQRRAVDLNTVVREVLDLAGSELITRNVLVSTELDVGAPAVMADRVQMQQVVLNLLINACEAMAGMPAAQRRVKVRTRFDTGSGAVEVTVADSGGGVSRGDLERIFQPFVTTKAHGMGLGLAICRSVAESHRGRLWAENGPQGGAVFHLVVPVEGGLA
jgi:PAS domain S-box-containing protein